MRKAGIPAFRGASSSASNTPYSAFNSGTAGEVRIDSNQMLAIDRLYNTSPSLQAARAILVGQLLSSGLSLTRSGEAVKLTPTFEKHLAARWMPFARTVVDSVLKFGFCVVSVEEDTDEPFAAFRKATAEPPQTAPEGKRKRPIGAPQTDGNGGAAAAARGGEVVKAAPRPSGNLVPVVPQLLTYEVALVPSGRCGYAREAKIFTTAPAHAYVLDEFSAIFFKTHPDHNGNVVSPIASVFEQVSFVNSLRELALSAETISATPTLVTQSAPRTVAQGAGGVDASNLFFDSESRAIQQQSADEEASERTKQLSLASRLAQELNRVRTTNAPGGASSSASASLPPEIPPRLFALPEKQQLVPSAFSATARSDLESLMRASNEAIACALGVPASVIFEGKFSSNSMSQLQLLNTTVASLALSINEILTSSYRAIYGTDDETELILRTAPLSSTSEVQALYTCGLIDYESALPAALHSLGSASEEISSALERKRKTVEREEALQKDRDVTERDELKARSKLAKNPPQPATAAAAAKPAAKPTKPQSDGE